MTERETRFRGLYVSHYPALLAYAMRRSPEASEAHDVVADAFLVLWRRFDDAPKTDDEVLLWLYAIARHVLANRFRTRQRQERLARRFAEALHEGATTEELAAQRRDARRLLEALLRLPESERELLMLATWEQLSTNQLAAVLGCSDNAAAIRLHRARKHLTEVYAKENEPTGHRAFEKLRQRRSSDRAVDE